MGVSKTVGKRIQKRAMQTAIKTVGGSQAELATLLGVHQSFVSQIATASRPVPAAIAVRIEEATHGAVTRADLRPIDFRALWPEFAIKVDQAKGAQSAAEAA
jgi:DNA-binding transcriptional regulator YdaS (Cro superfamily)